MSALNRIEQLLPQEIEKRSFEDLFNGRDDFGFGEMELKSNAEININTTYRGRELRFFVEDFNADACKDE